ARVLPRHARVVDEDPGRARAADDDLADLEVVREGIGPGRLDAQADDHVPATRVTAASREASTAKRGRKPARLNTIFTGSPIAHNASAPRASFTFLASASMTRRPALLMYSTLEKSMTILRSPADTSVNSCCSSPSDVVLSMRPTGATTTTPRSRVSLISISRPSSHLAWRFAAHAPRQLHVIVLAAALVRQLVEQILGEHDAQATGAPCLERRRGIGRRRLPRVERRGAVDDLHGHSAFVLGKGQRDGPRPVLVPMPDDVR